jgi:catalase
MAVKLLGVPGKKLIESESTASTQDFIFLSYPVFVISDPNKYVDFIKAFTQPGLANTLATAKSLGPKGAILAAAMKNKLVASSIQIPYFSMVPYQLGLDKDKSAVRYKVEPCAINGNDPVPKDTKDPYFLRAQLNAHFKKSDACMDFYVQKRTNENMSVEDSTDEWPSPWVKVATLTMKKGEQDNPDTAEPTDPINLACDKLSFNPWHSLPEHKPLGVMNRIRKVVYDHISSLRHGQNKEEKKEP